MVTKERINKLLHNKTVRNGGLFSIFSFFNKGIGFVLLMVLAKYIDPQEYGELSMFNTLIMFLGYFVGLCSAGYLGISFFRNDKEEFRRDFTAICVITLAMSAFLLLLFSLSYNWLSAMLQVSVQFLFIGLLISFANIFVQLNVDYMRVQERISWYGVLSCGFAILNFVLTLYFVIGLDQNWQGRVYAQLSCDIIFALIALFWFYRERLFKLTFQWKRYKKILWWSIPLIPHSASGWLRQGLDRYIINGSHDMSDVGLFSFALNLASIVIMVGMAFNQTNSVNLYQTLSSKTLSNAEKLGSLRRKEHFFTFVYILVTIAIMVGCAVLVPVVMPRYTAAIPYFFILAMYGLAQCLYFLHCNYLFYYDSTKQLMAITFGMSLVHVLLSFIFTRYSLYLTCIVNVVSMSAITLIVYFKSKKIKKKELINK